MSNKRKVKKIDIQTLDQIESKASAKIIRKVVTVILFLLIVGGGGLAAHRMMSEDVLASRFAVNKMTCPGCVITITEATCKLPGVIKADVSLAAQEATITFYEEKINPETIKAAITQAGYPVMLEGIFNADGEGVDEVVIAATVNGQPVFRKDVHFPNSERQGAEHTDMASDLFSVLGKKIILQAADKEQIVVQPYEIQQELSRLSKEKGISKKQLRERAVSDFGSVEKYVQMTAHRIGIQKLLEDHVLQDVQNSEEKERRIVKWLGKLLKSAEVKILDHDLKNKLLASTGETEWKTFWPRMLSRDTELRRILVR